jgi:hypothetical protein
MDLKAIAEKFDFSVKDLLEYRLHWMPRYVVFRSKVEKLTLTAGGETFDEWVRCDKRRTSAMTPGSSWRPPGRRP